MMNTNTAMDVEKCTEDNEHRKPPPYLPSSSIVISVVMVGCGCGSGGKKRRSSVAGSNDPSLDLLEAARCKSS